MILNTIELTESMKYDEVTWLLTKSKYSICAWGFGKYKEIISHSENCFRNYISKLVLASVIDFAREWGQFQ